MNALVVRREQRGTAHPVDRHGDSSGGGLLFGKSDCRARSLLVAARPFAVNPPLELYVDTGNEDPFEQLAAVEPERALEIPRGQGIVEGDRIAPESAGDDADLLIAPSRQHRASELTPQPTQGLAECSSRP